MKYLLFLTLITLRLLAYDDTDLDGVEDSIDRCPETPFSDLVDDTGCSIKTLFSQNAYDIILGIAYSDTNSNTFENAKTITSTFQVDYYRQNFSAQISGSYFNSQNGSYDERGFNDTQIAILYKIYSSPEFTFQSGIGAIFPTYKTGFGNEATDWIGLLNFQYTFDSSFNFFGGYTYTFINDTDIPNLVSYQNTHSFYAGIGYTGQNGFLKATYNESQNYIKGVEPIKTVSLSKTFTFDTPWFITADYRYGLSDSASNHEIGLQIGYLF